MPGSPAEHVYSVTEITQLIKGTLEEGFPWVTVQGEISNFRPSSTGHWYFSLKDTDAIIFVVMFRGRLDGVRFIPADGTLVKAAGSVSVYARRGSYQLICESLIKAGEGDLLARLEEMKRRLAAEGLFDLDRKKPLPLYPSRIAVVTSPTGAAVRDILRVLRRRSAGVDVVIIPTPVQGDGADERIARAIEIADRHRLGEVIIVGRGGGSLEDLMPFSSEIVVRAIASSKTPVISAVGHETDVTLADLAADVRAPTPSAAAEMVAASRADLLARVRGTQDSMAAGIRQRTERVRLLMAQFAAENLERNVRLFVQPLSQRADYAREELLQEFREMVTARRHRCTLASRELASYSPLAILARGYAVVTHEPTGKILLSPDPVNRGERLAIRLSRGRIRATVEETDAGEKQ
ncbi:MAG: exodeoxyribonuclease VII large subunit [Spirochaetia bacterium]|jgi:exodeoxyribonuclease VII large subunit